MATQFCSGFSCQHGGVTVMWLYQPEIQFSQRCSHNYNSTNTTQLASAHAVLLLCSVSWFTLKNIFDKTTSRFLLENRDRHAERLCSPHCCLSSWLPHSQWTWTEGEKWEIKSRLYWFKSLPPFTKRRRSEPWKSDLTKTAVNAEGFLVQREKKKTLALTKAFLALRWSVNERSRYR